MNNTSPANSPAIQQVFERLDRCKYNQSGDWRVLYYTDEDGKRLTFLALLPLGGPYDLAHIICLIPFDDPVMALGANQAT